MILKVLPFHYEIIMIIKELPFHYKILANGSYRIRIVFSHIWSSDFGQYLNDSDAECGISTSLHVFRAFHPNTKYLTQRAGAKLLRMYVALNTSIINIQHVLTVLQFLHVGCFFCFSVVWPNECEWCNPTAAGLYMWSDCFAPWNMQFNLSENLPNQRYLNTISKYLLNLFSDCQLHFPLYETSCQSHLDRLLPIICSVSNTVGWTGIRGSVKGSCPTVRPNPIKYQFITPWLCVIYYL